MNKREAQSPDFRHGVKITWIFNDVEISGGVKSVFCISNCLVERGHEVNIIYPLIPMEITPKKVITKGYKAIAIFKKRSRGGLWFDLKANLIRVPYLSNCFIPDADVIIATWWETAYVVKKLSPSKGKKFYFIQHYETWGGAKDKVDGSYRLGLNNIVNSQWTKEQVEAVGGKVVSKIFHAPDWGQFKEVYVGRHEGIRILMQYRKDAWKGIDDGILAFVIAHSQHNDTQLVMFGREKGDVPDWVEFHVNPTNEELNLLYRSCDIFLFSSVVEGFGMPPMEAMCCKLPVVTTKVGVVSEFSVDDEIALVSEPNNPQGLVDNLVKLIGDGNLRKKIGLAGYDYVKKFTWESATNQLLRSLDAQS